MIKASAILSVFCWTCFFPMAVYSWLALFPLKLYFGKDLVVSPYRLLSATFLPFLASIRSIRRKSLDTFGAVIAFLVGFTLMMANFSFFAMLFAFYLSSTKLTKFKQDVKAKQDKEAEKKPRSFLNVLCNSLPAVICSLLYIMQVGCVETYVDLSPNSKSFTSSWLSVGVIGSISSVCADTWASEIGSAFNKYSCILITNGKKVPPGTNGGISVIGIISSLLGGLFIGLVYCTFMLLFINKFNYQILITSTLSGLFGSVVDSIMGATIQYSGYDKVKGKVVSQPSLSVKHISGSNIISNHSVNLLSSLLTCLVAPHIHIMINK